MDLGADRHAADHAEWPTGDAGDARQDALTVDQMSRHRLPSLTSVGNSQPSVAKLLPATAPYIRDRGLHLAKDNPSPSFVRARSLSSEWEAASHRRLPSWPHVGGPDTLPRSGRIGTSPR